MTSKEKVLKYIDQNLEFTVVEMVNALIISKQYIHVILKKLLEDGSIEKFGRVPKTFYRKKLVVKSSSDNTFSQTEEEFLKDTFIQVTESGDYLEGVESFLYWCEKRSLPMAKTFIEFQKTFEKYELYRDKKNFINGLPKIQNTKQITAIHLDELYYFDFYAIERFGKTRMGNLLHYAKQGQSVFLMQKIMEGVQSKLEQLIKRLKPDAIGFVPPTIKRSVQLMDYLERRLSFGLPILNIKKTSGLIAVPQKSLSKMEDRISNAQNTFAIYDNNQFEKILLVDDAVGSGATLNEIASKLKNKGTTQSVVGLSLVGSFKGFDIISGV